MTQTGKEYAEALFELAVNSSRVEETSTGLHTVKNELTLNPEYRALLASPAIPRKERLAALDHSFGGEVPDIVLAILSMLVSRGQVSALDSMIREFERLNEERQGISRASVVSAVPLNEAEKDQLRQTLEKRFGGKMELDCRTDSSLLGGVRVEVNGQVLDGSLKNKLQKMKEVMDK